MAIESMIAVPVILMGYHHRDIAHEPQGKGCRWGNFIFFDRPGIVVSCVPVHIVTVRDTNSTNSQWKNRSFNKADGLYPVLKEQFYENFRIGMGGIQHREHKVLRVCRIQLRKDPGAGPRVFLARKKLTFEPFRALGIRGVGQGKGAGGFPRDEFFHIAPGHQVLCTLPVCAESGEGVKIRYRKQTNFRCDKPVGRHSGRRRTDAKTMMRHLEDVRFQIVTIPLRELGSFAGCIRGPKGGLPSQFHTDHQRRRVNILTSPDGVVHGCQNFQHRVADPVDLAGVGTIYRDMMEPGSTFKTASIMVALEDKYITPDQNVDTGNGVYNMHGRPMKDHNWHRGGYGVINTTQVLMYSSNIGVSRLVDENYHKNPGKFVEGLYKLGIATPLNLDIPGAAKKPNIRKPNKDNWSKTALAWMSIGYETQVPPMNTLAFYNAIANNGKMVKPRFVKSIVKDGEVVQDIPVEVLNPAIASPKTIEQIQMILEKVVSEGLGKKAGSKQFLVSGKTGTAQVSQGKGGYKSGTMQYLVSFCGYFPSDAPKYSCIVAIQKSGLPASGGLMAGSVFSEIAERVFAKHLALDIKEAKDSTAILTPDVKHGDLVAAHYVLDKIDIEPNKNSDTWDEDKPIWGNIKHTPNADISLIPKEINEKRIPNVVGMGAKDAVYLLESLGLKVQLAGMGKVRSQSIMAGNTLHKGKTIHLRLH